MKKIERLTFLLGFLLLSAGCNSQSDPCLPYEGHASIYKDAVEDLYITIYINEKEALMIENREATDVSPNPVATKLNIKDGAFWFVDMAIPIGERKLLYKNANRTCNLMQSNESSSRFSCVDQKGVTTVYDLHERRGLMLHRVFDQTGKLISHIELLSEKGAFFQHCRR